MKWISILLFLFLGACASQPKHTYLKYSGYIDGCADTATQLVLATNAEAREFGVNPVWLDTMCMEMYLLKLEAEDIKPPMKRVDRNEMI